MLGFVGVASGVIPFIIPAVGSTLGGIALRTGTGAVVKKVGLPIAESWAAKAAASNMLGTIAVGTIAFCGTGSVLDVCQENYFKARPGGASGFDEGAAGSVAPTTEQQAATNSTYWRSQGGGGGDITTQHASAESACQNPTNAGWCLGPGGYTSFNSVSGSGALRSCVFNWAGGQGNCFQVAEVSGETCPSGWTGPAGGQCTRQVCPGGFNFNFQTSQCDPSAGMWTADNKPTFYNNAGNWANEPLDPDVPSMTPSGTINLSGIQPNGLPANVTITPTPSGGINITTNAQLPPNSSGQTTTINNQIFITNPGHVSNVVTNIYMGDITENSNQHQQPGGEGAKIEFPTDYAREPTLESVKVNTAAIKTATEALKNDMEAANTEGQTINQTLNQQNADMGKYHDISKMGLPSQTENPYTPVSTTALKNAVPGGGACAAYPLDLPHFGVVNVNPCPFYSFMKPVFEWAFMLGCILTSVFMVFNFRKEGTAEA